MGYIGLCSGSEKGVYLIIYLYIYLFTPDYMYNLQCEAVFLLSCCVHTVDSTLNFLKFIENKIKSLGGTHTYVIVLVPSSSVFLNVY